LRRDVREKKIFVTGGASMIDIDKPDPEPVSVDGYRNWSTTDGLFKTNAKFVALIDVTNDDGKIIDRDVQLLRKDGKKVAIELSGLRSTDREYVRQQLEPLRDWATLDGSLKIKAKLLGKFDKEIILEESDGITTLVQIENLTDKDKEYLKQKTLSPHSKYAF
ncbi:MAG: hypothetical protein LBQ66_16230, partial [Planctomycetaceae bacterium]|jgi:hypothetical protein|nr:hypothetical protein [Planctomycetaceae bacterium]